MSEPTKVLEIREPDAAGPRQLTFYVGRLEWMKLTEDGKAYVRGELVATNQDVYEGFKAWWERAQGIESSNESGFTSHRFEEPPPLDDDGYEGLPHER